MALPTARQVTNSVEHEAIDSVEATHDGHIVRFIDGSYISATHHTKGEVPEYYPEIEDEDSEQWEEPAGYNWVHVKEDEDARDGYPEADDDPAALEGAIIYAADQALELHPWPHTQVLTTTIASPDYDVTVPWIDDATVSWMPEEVTGYDAGPENIGRREWAWVDENDCPVHWVRDPATGTYDLEERIVQFTGSTQLTMSAHKVDDEDDLEPGTYYIHPAPEPEATDLGTLAARVSGRLGIDDNAASDALKTYIGQIEEIDERTIDVDEISEEDADFLMGACVAGQRAGDFGEQELVEVKELVEQLDHAEQVVEDLRQRRDAALRRALASGARVTDTMTAGRVSRSRLDQIKKGTR